MAGQRLTDKAIATSLAKEDLLMVVDVSDTTGSPLGTSKQIKAEYTLNTNILNLTSSQINAMATGYEIVPTPGAGFFVQLISVTTNCEYISVENTSGSALQIGASQTFTAGHCWCLAGKFYQGYGNKSATFDHRPTKMMTGDPVIIGGTLENKPMYITANSNFNGDWSMSVYTTYKIVPM